MLPRISSPVLALAVTGVFLCAGELGAQNQMPLQLTSLEWLVADSEVVVRGVVVDVAADTHWNVVTIEVAEALKGAKAQRLKFAMHKFDQGDAALAQWRQSKRELLWLLKRQDSAAPGEAPDREKLLARHKIDLYATFFPRRPGEAWLPAIPLGPPQEQEAQQPLPFLTIDLRLLKTSDELVKAIRTAIAAPQGDGKVRSYSVSLPPEIAERTGFSRAQNYLTVPVDRRLEEFARRLIQTPGDYMPKLDSEKRSVTAAEGIAFLNRQQALRLEGVKALRLFPSEKNVAIVRLWLDDPMSTEPFKDDRQALVPAVPKSQQAEAKVALPLELAQVPEIHFQQPLTKALNTELGLKAGPEGRSQTKVEGLIVR